MKTQSQPVIEVTDLVKRYSEVRAVDNISFTIQPGEVFGMLGPNGAGKTTTIECIEGLRQPDQGQNPRIGIGSACRRVPAAGTDWYSVSIRCTARPNQESGKRWTFLPVFISTRWITSSCWPKWGWRKSAMLSCQSSPEGKSSAFSSRWP